MSSFLWMIIGYLCGGLMFAGLIPKYILKTDIREISDDGNPGAGNVFKHIGIGWGLCCLLLDMAKGFIPVYWASRTVGVQALSFTLIMAAPVIGHAFPLIYKGHGGKGIAVTFGVLLGVMPYCNAVWLLAVLLVVFTGLVIIRPTHIRVILCFLLFSLWCRVRIVQPAILYGCYLIAVIVILRHLLAPNAGKWQIRFYPAELLQEYRNKTLKP